MIFHLKEVLTVIVFRALKIIVKSSSKNKRAQQFKKAVNWGHRSWAAGEAQRRHCALLNTLGLDTHEESAEGHFMESLGVRVDGLSGRVAPTAAKDWRLDDALEACEKRRMAGWELQVMTLQALRKLLPTNSKESNCAPERLLTTSRRA